MTPTTVQVRHMGDYRKLDLAYIQKLQLVLADTVLQHTFLQRDMQSTTLECACMHQATVRTASRVSGIPYLFLLNRTTFAFTYSILLQCYKISLPLLLYMHAHHLQKLPLISR